MHRVFPTEFAFRTLFITPVSVARVGFGTISQYPLAGMNKVSTMPNTHTGSQATLPAANMSTLLTMEHTFIDLDDEIRCTNVDWVSLELARVRMESGQQLSDGGVAVSKPMLCLVEEFFCLPAQDSL